MHTISATNSTPRHMFFTILATTLVLVTSLPIVVYGQEDVDVPDGREQYVYVPVNGDDTNNSNNNSEDEEESESDSEESDEGMATEEQDTNVNEQPAETPPNVTTGNGTAAMGAGVTPTSQPLTASDVQRAEQIDNNGIVQNPGGGPIQEESMAVPTENLQEVVNPSTVQTTNIENIRIALQGIGYPISDIQPIMNSNNEPVIKIRATEGVFNVPNQLDIDTQIARFGYYVDEHVPLDGAWTTDLKSITGS